MANETTQAKSSTALAVNEEQELREPIIINLGKKKRSQVRKLKKGKEGRLLDRVTEALEEGIAAKAIPADSQPVIVVVREKKKKRKYGKMWGLG